MTMTIRTKKTLLAVLAAIAVVFLGVLAYALSPSTTRNIESAGAGQATPVGPALVQAGAYVAAASDCIACHTAPGGKPFAGGRAVQSPIGAMYSTNITPDQATGIGSYSLDDFDRAIRHGIRRDGTTLYPAMPYPSYARMSDQDLRALYAYFLHGGVQAVNANNRRNDIRWPLSIRWPVALWRKTFAPPDMAPLDPGKYQNRQLARGAYLVQGAGHCGTCHTPRALTMQERALDESGREFLAGGPLIDGWRALNLRGDKADGLGSWTEQDIVDTLRTGRNGATAVVGGPMNDVVAHSMQFMNEDDLRAIALYLKSLPATGESKSTFTADPRTAQLLSAGRDRDNRGAQLYLDNCNACHRSDGRANRITFPALPGNPTVLADDPSSLIRLVLAGSRLPSTRLRPSDLAMPGFGWRLSDEEAAQLATFVRNGWGNRAGEVSAAQVAGVRQALREDGGADLDRRDTAH